MNSKIMKFDTQKVKEEETIILQRIWKNIMDHYSNTTSSRKYAKSKLAYIYI